MEERCRELFNDLIYCYPEVIPELMQCLRKLTEECGAAFIDEEENRISFISLNKEDGEAFIKALLNPPEPNEALLKAAIRYKEIIVEN